MTLILGGVLSSTSVVLKPLQTKQMELDAQRRILGAVMDVKGMEAASIQSIYQSQCEPLVINHKGDPMPVDKQGKAWVASRISIRKNHKVPLKERPLPLYLFKEAGSEEVSAYIFPMFGTGLWDWISGYIALEADLNTIRGLVFDHKTETPGLGARIASLEVQNRYKQKKILDEEGRLVAVRMLKGEGGSPAALDAHHVDGLSGATMTGRGVNIMLKEYLGYYLPYMKKRRQAQNLN